MVLHKSMCPHICVCSAMVYLHSDHACMSGASVFVVVPLCRTGLLGCAGTWPGIKLALPVERRADGGPSLDSSTPRHQLTAISHQWPTQIGSGCFFIAPAKRERERERERESKREREGHRAGRHTHSQNG